MKQATGKNGRNGKQGCQQVCQVKATACWPMWSVGTGMTHFLAGTTKGSEVAVTA